MQQKQLRAILRIDNTVLQQSQVPDQLVFRNASKQCMSGLRDCTSNDYLMSTAGELLKARQFLKFLNLDPQLAGIWENDLVTLKFHAQTSEEELVWATETFKKFNKNHNGELEVDTNSPTTKRKREITEESVQFINGFRENDFGAEDNPQDRSASPRLNAAKQILKRRKRTSRQARRPLHRPSPSTPSTTGSIVRLKVGPEGAAKIGNFLASKDPAMLLGSGTVSQTPTAPIDPIPDTLQRFSDADTTYKTPSDSAQVSHPREYNDDLPVARKLGGIWCYKTKPQISSSMKLQRDLFAAKRESDLQRRVESEATQSEITNVLKDLPLRTESTFQGEQKEVDSREPCPCEEQSVSKSFKSTPYSELKDSLVGATKYPSLVGKPPSSTHTYQVENKNKTEERSYSLRAPEHTANNERKHAISNYGTVTGTSAHEEGSVNTPHTNNTDTNDGMASSVVGDKIGEIAPPETDDTLPQLSACTSPESMVMIETSQAKGIDDTVQDSPDQGVLPEIKPASEGLRESPLQSIEIMPVQGKDIAKKKKVQKKQKKPVRRSERLSGGSERVLRSKK